MQVAIPVVLVKCRNSIQMGQSMHAQRCWLLVFGFFGLTFGLWFGFAEINVVRESWWYGEALFVGMACGAD